MTVAMNSELTALTRPRISSGVSTCASETRIATLTAACFFFLRLGPRGLNGTRTQGASRSAGFPCYAVAHSLQTGV